MHEGVFWFICHRRGWPALYSSLADAPTETAEVMIHALATMDTPNENEMLDQMTLETEAIWQSMGLTGF